MIKNIILLGFVYLLSACASKPKTALEIGSAIEINSDLKANSEYGLANIPNESEIFYLTEKQKIDFLSYQSRQLEHGIPRHEVVASYIQNLLFGFTYKHKTYKASDAIQLKAGNCMSYAIVTAAIAELAGVEYDFNEMLSSPVFQKEKGMLWVIGHVQTKLYDPNFVEKENTMYISRPGIVIDYLPELNSSKGARIGVKDFVSMYYSNIAAELIAEGKKVEAFYYALKAHQENPSSVQNVNLLAVLHRHLGDVVVAENLYMSAMKMNNKSISVLNNYRILLERQKREKDAELIQREMEKLNDPNPYNWLEQAYIALEKKETKRATRYFVNVIKRAPYLKEAYVGLYNIKLSEGDIEGAMDVLSKVLPWVYDKDDKRQFKNKLWALNKKATG